MPPPRRANSAWGFVMEWHEKDLSLPNRFIGGEPVERREDRLGRVVVRRDLLQRFSALDAMGLHRRFHR